MRAAPEFLTMTAPLIPSPTVPSPVEVITLGCRLNAYESEAMRVAASAAGVEDVVVVNTCAVTNEAVRQARQTIRRTRRERPDARIVVTGCAAQIDPAGFAAMAEVDHVVGNAEKMAPATWAKITTADAERVLVDDIMSVRETAGHLIDGLADRVRAYVQVQNGCDHRCTFCIIPFGRGNARSVPAGEVVEQIRRLAARGVPEVVLTGVDLTSWGGDLPGKPQLGDLVRRILKLAPELQRLRISSIDAIEMDEALFEAFATEPRLMPHLHLSLQHGADMILKRMKRRHSRADALALIARLRAARPDIAFGADLIAGFPTETEAHFQDMLDLVDDAGLAFLHVFAFSPRPGTPAAKMPQLPKDVIKTRAARLRAHGEAARTRFLAAHVGSVQRVLVEREGRGRLDSFAEVELDGGAAGEIVTARITGSKGGVLTARIV
jgi:threonylcarbamoyladenosine tRNA methylthiotransferase MtaB